MGLIVCALVGRDIEGILASAWVGAIGVMPRYHLRDAARDMRERGRKRTIIASVASLRFNIVQLY